MCSIPRMVSVLHGCMLHVTHYTNEDMCRVECVATLHVTHDTRTWAVCSYVTCYMLHVTRGHGQSVLQCQCVVCSVTLVSIPGRCPGTRPPVAPWETAATAPSHCNPSTTTTLCTHPGWAHSSTLHSGDGNEPSRSLKFYNHLLGPR